MVKFTLKKYAPVSDPVSEAASALASEVYRAEILKCSVDARRKSDVHYTYTIAADVKNEAKLIRSGKAERYEPKAEYEFPYSIDSSQSDVIVVGMGPAGLLAALSLAESGIKCTVLERGRDVDRRTADVSGFWRTGKLDETSNVQFGEGGAGTFSDGKLNTGVKDERMMYILKRLVEFGAPDDILYQGKPHIGTDVLRTVVKNIRLRLIELGCTVRFESKLTGIEISNGTVTGVTVNEGELLPCSYLVLAPGNSARDTFEMLKNAGIVISKKNFAVGVRIEHLQKEIDLAQYGEAATLGTLPVSNYKLASHLASGRHVFTFCVCPGGTVVAAASERGRVVTNGMSERARDGINCCGGLLVGVEADDFPGDELAGIEFQRILEKKAFVCGGENYSAPAQLVGDFLKKRPSTVAGAVKPTYMPGVKFCNLWDVMPEFICQAIADALPDMDRKIHGFASPDAVMTAVETRSSCPIRIDREDMQAVGISGLYPCGEGAGYAGGIMSAATDGIRCAEHICCDILKKRGR